MKAKSICMALVMLPSVAGAQGLDRDQLIQIAIERGVCGELTPVDAWYEPEGSNTVKVSCSEATGFIPVAGALGLGAGGTIAAAVVAGFALSGGGSTPSTD